MRESFHEIPKTLLPRVIPANGRAGGLLEGALFAGEQMNSLRGIWVKAQGLEQDPEVPMGRL